MKKFYIAVLGILTVAGVCIWFFNFGDESSSDNLQDRAISSESTTKGRFSRGPETAEKNFSRMSREEKRSSLTTRLESLSYLTDHDQLRTALASLRRDIETLNSFERLPYTEAIEANLAAIPGEPLDKLLWLAEFLPTIEESLEGRMTPFGDSVTQMFSRLAGNFREGNLDVYETVKQMSDARARSSVAARLIPHLFLFTGAEQNDLLVLTTDTDVTLAEDGMIRVAASQGALQHEAIEMYLSGHGTDASDQGIGKFFNQPDWFHKNPERLINILEASQSGPRKDRVISEMVNVICRRDTEVAAAWAEEISDGERRSKALQVVEKNRSQE
jgi:hypothetical protein